MTIMAKIPSQMAKPLSPVRQTWRMFAANRIALGGLAVLLLVALVALFGPQLYQVDPKEIVAAPMTPPFSDGPLLGSDYVGRDILAGILGGARVTLLVGLSAAALTLLIGIAVGALAGYYGGWVDSALMRITELFQVMPPLLFAMVVVMLFKPGVATISIAIGIVSWPHTARLARGEFLKLREMDYVRAERAIGATHARIIWAVILPNAAPPLIVSGALSVGLAILFEAGLSFLGLSDPNSTSWGRMVGDNRPYVLDSWWGVTFPGLAILISVLAINLMGDGLRDALDPKLKRS